MINRETETQRDCYLLRITELPKQISQSFDLGSRATESTLLTVTLDHPSRRKEDE